LLTFCIPPQRPYIPLLSFPSSSLPRGTEKSFSTTATPIGLLTETHSQLQHTHKEHQMDMIQRKRGTHRRNVESIDIDDLLDDSNYLGDMQELHMDDPGRTSPMPHLANALQPKPPPKSKAPSSYKPPIVLPGRSRVVTSNTRDLIDFLAEGLPCSCIHRTLTN
jgi:hypothetical protein